MLMLSGTSCPTRILSSGSWIDPHDGRTPFGSYAATWISERPGLRPTTAQVYGYLLRRHLDPAFGRVPIADIRDGHVRRWRSELLAAGASTSSVAKSYRLLKAIMNTAVEDGIIRRNPCRIRGAAQDRSRERPVLTLRQALTLAESTESRYQALILLAVFCSLRWGELTALRRCDLDLGNRTVRVERSLSELPGGGVLFGPPKTESGRRVVAIPRAIVPAITDHLDDYVPVTGDALIFTSQAGTPLRHGNFRRQFWLPALTRTGLEGTHFHDLRHTGNNLTAATGATLRELMDRMGHSSSRAALIYLHGSDARQQEIAASISKLVRAELRRGTRTQTRASPQADRARNGHARERDAIGGTGAERQDDA